MDFSRIIVALLIAAAPLAQEHKDYWLKQIPSMSEAELASLHAILVLQSPAELAQVQADQVAARQKLEAYLEAMPKQIRALYQEAEAKQRAAENPDALLAELLQNN